MGIPELIQTAFLIICSIVGWSIRKTLQEELRPIKEDMSQLRQSVDKIADIIKDHLNSPSPHPVFEDKLNTKFITRKEFELALELADASQLKKNQRKNKVS